MEQEQKKALITILNDQGEEVECEVLFTFDSEETKKSYIVYTDDTADEAGNTKVYASIYDPSGADKALTPIETEEEWLIVENVFSSIQAKLEEKETAE